MKSRTILLVAVALVIGCTSSGNNMGVTGGTNGGTTGGGSPAMVNMTSNFTFSPQTVSVPPGGQVTWTNSSNVPHHSATGDLAGGPDSDSQYPAGVPMGSSYTFAVPAGAAHGSKIFYHCRFHGTAGNGSSLGQGMAGEIDVQ